VQLHLNDRARNSLVAINPAINVAGLIVYAIEPVGKIATVRAIAEQ
jgi:hypothetical protein